VALEGEKGQFARVIRRSGRLDMGKGEATVRDGRTRPLPDILKQRPEARLGLGDGQRPHAAAPFFAPQSIAPGMVAKEREENAINGQEIVCRTMKSST